jgi:heme/copper-type cytochrome/quinol oxidase subunit 2
MACGAYAQGCALCYTTAAAAGPAAARSLDLGILALVTPALVLFLAVIFLLFRRAATAAV